MPRINSCTIRSLSATAWSRPNPARSPPEWSMLRRVQPGCSAATLTTTCDPASASGGQSFAPAIAFPQSLSRLMRSSCACDRNGRRLGLAAAWQRRSLSPAGAVYGNAVITVGAKKRTRTSTPFRALEPESSASANSATFASGALISSGLARKASASHCPRLYPRFFGVCKLISHLLDGCVRGQVSPWARARAPEDTGGRRSALGDAVVTDSVFCVFMPRVPTRSRNIPGILSFQPAQRCWVLASFSLRAGAPVPSDAPLPCSPKPCQNAKLAGRACLSVWVWEQE